MAVLNRYGTEGILNGEYTTAAGYASAMALSTTHDWTTLADLLHDAPSPEPMNESKDLAFGSRDEGVAPHQLRRGVAATGHADKRRYRQRRLCRSIALGIVRLVLTVAVVAGQRAVAVVHAGGGVAQYAIQGLNVGGVEINQVRLGGRVRIVAGGAGGAVLLDVFLVFRPARGQAAVHHGTAVTFVAQGEVARIVGAAVGQQQLAFEQRRKGGTVRTIRTGAAGGRALVAVMAIAAADQAGRRQRRNEAG